MYIYNAYISYTINRRVYVFICLFVRLFVCMFALSSVLLTNRLTQALKIRIDYSVNFFGSSKHIFNFQLFVIKKLRVFKERTEQQRTHREIKIYAAILHATSLKAGLKVLSK